MIPADKIQTMMGALKAAVEDGSITKEQARQFRDEVGIRKSAFTKKGVTPTARKAKRKAQKAARKANR